MKESKLESFQSIYRRACERKGGERVLEAMLQAPLSKAQIEAIPDDRFLAAMTKKVFQSGFVWRVIEQISQNHVFGRFYGRNRGVNGPIVTCF